MSFVSRGFSGRRHTTDPRLPPGQTLVDSWPVLTAGPTPQIDTADWQFAIRDEAAVHRWSFDELIGLGVEDITVDIHCVTHWSKLDMSWRGVSLDRLLAGVDTELDFVMAHSYGGYTTNLPLADLRNGQAWIAIEADGRPLSPDHGGPARLLVPHLYFWKSAKWIRGLTLMPTDDPGFWEQNGYHRYGDPWREQRYG
ncbi:molybdopterin-dependent oxidoreductase [Microlunatus sp. Gsoil 973]|jgi:DMSO/TMAO reductase YedYZ molybdopterin-dependent catalytic subunit|uniref:molybdopterin-dependent oxidoreductase n=1 Tax=Microlunatus sp. Gsoil 973 TaxID=2672569 RepID=UPI0012B4FCE3|nr:molybdopterin-dependent oxidoreductase [Microlunatus sp. Gsoil 973]QGN33230.1 molybdopterin-dependent oxidoreductase [Microlunatus sp. Gsoil 973]